MPRPTLRRQTNLRSTRTRRAFSLIELLTVIGILAILMAIIIPAMNSSRRTAKMADTRATLAQLQQACSSFTAENRRDPGYFSPKLMGATANATAGFDSMSNIMLDLMGGDVAPNTPITTGIIKVGPGGTLGTTGVLVDLGKFGASHQDTSGQVIKNYFVADQKKMVAQKDPNQRFGNGAGAAPGSGNPFDYLPSLVDAFGSPILAWVQDNPNAQNFAQDVSPTVSSPAADAQFYWNQNAAFLDSSVSSLGKLAETQNFNNGGSLLSNAGVSSANRWNTMAALLGNPAAADPATPAKPAAPRGPIVFQSAGPDGVFVGKRDKGGNAGVRMYQANKDDFNGTLFDDQIMAAGH